MPAVRDDGVTPVIAIILLVAMTVIFATVTGAVLLSTSSSVGSAKILSVSAEGGTSEIPVFVHLNAGTDLEKLVKVYARNAAGNNFAVTKSGAVFSPGVVLETEPMMCQSGGPQMVSLYGEFADGTEQLLWEGELTLEEGGMIVSAEAGTAEIPVLIHLTAGKDLEKLVKVSAYDAAGNKFAVTKPGAVFSPGVVLETEPMMCQSGGLQMVSLFGKFTDGTEQLLWEGELTLEKGREIVWMGIVDGAGYYYYWVTPPYYYWKVRLVNKITGTMKGAQTYFKYYPDINTLKMEYYPESSGTPISKEIIISDTSTYENVNLGVSKLFEPFQNAFGINMTTDGHIKLEKSDQVFKTYTG